MKNIRVLELRSVWGTGGGPDKTILSGAALKSPSGVETVVCYIRDARDRVYALDRRARDLGIDYEEIVERNSFDRSIWPALRALVRRRRIDIVHAHDYKTDLLTLVLSRFEPIVPLSTAHAFVGSGATERYVYYPLDRWLLARYPRVIAVSNTVRDELVRAGARADRVTVILNGIDHCAFVRDRRREPEVRRELGFGTDDVVIGAVGRLDYEKRFDLLIEAFADVRKTYPRAQLAIAGDGKHRPALAATIERLDLQSSCRLLGLQRDVARLHHAFDLFVQSSIREGTPNAVLEAMALETPIIATDSGGTAELVKHEVHGLIVPTGSADVLRDAILGALRESEATRERVRAARRRVESELSFARRMDRVERVYHELMAGRFAQQRAS
jgi:glycosyltransferase involved in cell wall biosynthesis